MLKYKITQTRQEKKAGKWVIVSGSTETVDSEWVKRFMDAIPFFKGLGGKEETQGSKASPKKHTSTSPCGTMRTITEFEEVEGC